MRLWARIRSKELGKNMKLLFNSYFTAINVWSFILFPSIAVEKYHQILSIDISWLFFKLELVLTGWDKFDE